jgi:hypothetical protein
VDHDRARPGLGVERCAGAGRGDLCGVGLVGGDEPRTALELASQIRAGHAAAHRPRMPRIVAAMEPDDTDWIRDPHIGDALPQRYELMEMRLNGLIAEDGLRPPEWTRHEFRTTANSADCRLSRPMEHRAGPSASNSGRQCVGSSG